jgi:hypothetical protein
VETLVEASSLCDTLLSHVNLYAAYRFICQCESSGSQSVAKMRLACVSDWRGDTRMAAGGSRRSAGETVESRSG